MTRTRKEEQHFTVWAIRPDQSFFLVKETRAMSRAQAVNRVRRSQLEWRYSRLNELPVTLVARGVGEVMEVVQQ